MSPPGCILSNSVIKTPRCRIHFTQIQISRLLVRITHTMDGHKVIFYTSSKKWGQRRDTTIVGASILNWTQWSDQTSQDILDHIYLEWLFLKMAIMMTEELKFMSASSYFSLDHLVTQYESSLFRPTQFQNLLQLFLKLVKNFRSKLKSTSKRSSLKVKSIISQKRAGREISVHCNTISWRTS